MILLRIIGLALFKFCRMTSPGDGVGVETVSHSVPAADFSSQLVITHDDIKHDAFARALCTNVQVLNACRDTKRLQA